MNKSDGQKLKNFIEAYYKTRLTDNELIALSRELKDYTYEDFTNELQKPLLLAVEHFSVAGLHRIVENNKRAKKYLSRSGKSSWEEFYAN